MGESDFAGNGEASAIASEQTPGTSPGNRPQIFTRHPYLIRAMQTPTSAQLHTAIEVLEKLRERINIQAAHSAIQLPDTQLGNHYAGQIGTKAIEQIVQLETVTAKLEIWRTELQQKRRQNVSQRI